MVKSFFLLSLAVVPVLVPLRAPYFGDIEQCTLVEIGKVPLPQLPPQHWKILRRQQGADYQTLRIDVKLGVSRGRIYGLRVLHGTGYPVIDETIVDWIQANWKTASWFEGDKDFAVSFDVDPALQRVVFRKLGKT
jgi:hypothetical protein